MADVKLIDANKLIDEFKNIEQRECTAIFVNKIIEIIEGQPIIETKLSEDAISRTDLLKDMDTLDKFGYTSNGSLIPMRETYAGFPFVPYVHYDDMVNCVKSMPSVQPNPKRLRGHWITDGYNSYCFCSNCERILNNGRKNIDIIWRPDYCPNCGADMRESEEEKT